MTQACSCTTAARSPSSSTSRTGCTARSSWTPSTPLPKADREYVLVASEWYLTTDGLTEPAQGDFAKMHAVTPDWTTFNGYAGQYVAHPLTADPGDTVRFYVVDAGPSMTTAFHVVGTILDKAYVDGDMNPAHVLEGVQTVNVPAGGGGVFEVTIEGPGSLPVREPRLCERRPGSGRLAEGGQPKGDDVALTRRSSPSGWPASPTAILARAAPID